MTYTARVTFEGSLKEPGEVVSFLGVQWSAGRANLTLVGTEEVTTCLGAMSLNHYHQGG
jgi:hypothetical protein